MARNPIEMFRLRLPCENCPFRKDTGHLFGLSYQRLQEIYFAPSFQCHKSVDYSKDSPLSGGKPLQCAGIIALQYKEGKLNQITQLAARLLSYDPSTVASNSVYESYAQCVEAHTTGEAPNATTEKK